MVGALGVSRKCFALFRSAAVNNERTMHFSNNRARVAGAAVIFVLFARHKRREEEGERENPRSTRFLDSGALSWKLECLIHAYVKIVGIVASNS